MEKQVYIPAVNATVKTEKTAHKKCCDNDCPYLVLAIERQTSSTATHYTHWCNLFANEVKSYTHSNSDYNFHYERLQQCKDAEDAENVRTPAERFGKTAFRGLNILQCCYCNTVFVQTDKGIASCAHCHCKETQPFYIYGL